MINIVHVDRVLSNFAVDFQPADSIADSVLPLVPVDQQSNLYSIFDQGPQWRREADLRSPGATARKIQLTASSARYYTPNYELMSSVTIEEIGNADPVTRMKLDQKAVANTRLKIDLGRESRLAIAMHASCGSRTQVASIWTDHANSDPFSDIRTAMRNVWLTTGYWPNKAVCNGVVWDHLSQNYKLLDAVRNPNVTARAGFMSNVDGIAALLGLDNIYVGKMLENRAEEGATAALTQVWSNAFIVYYAPNGVGLNDPTFMAQFRWNPEGLGGTGYYVQRHPFDTRAKIQDISVGHYTSETTVFSAAGFACTVAA